MPERGGRHLDAVEEAARRRDAQREEEQRRSQAARDAEEATRRQAAAQQQQQRVAEEQRVAQQRAQAGACLSLDSADRFSISVSPHILTRCTLMSAQGIAIDQFLRLSDSPLPMRSGACRVLRSMRKRSGGQASSRLSSFWTCILVANFWDGFVPLCPPDGSSDHNS